LHIEGNIISSYNLKNFHLPAVLRKFLPAENFACREYKPLVKFLLAGKKLKKVVRSRKVQDQHIEYHAKLLVQVR